MKRLLVVSMTVWAAGAAQAQTDARRPADPQAPAPPPQYQSAFTEYQPFREPELAKWREANEEVKAAGEHGAHEPKAESGAKPAAEPATKPGAPAKPPAGGHAGH